MRNVKYLLAAAAIGGLMTLPQASSASPLAVGLGNADSAASAITADLAQNIHYKKYKKKKYYGHKHYRRYPRYRRYYYDDYYDDDFYYPYFSYYPYRRYYHPYRYHPGPFITFGFGF